MKIVFDAADFDGYFSGGSATFSLEIRPNSDSFSTLVWEQFQKLEATQKAEIDLGWCSIQIERKADL